MEFKNIICPTDGTEVSESALRHAAYLSRLSGAKVLLLHVVEKWYRASHLVTDSNEWDTIHKEWLESGRAVLEKEAEKLLAYGATQIDTVLRDGDASHEILALAVEKRADLIVMATHRYSPVGKIFAGSVTDNVTKKSPCPVLWVFQAPPKK